jgi:hypothetical protein
MSAPSAPQARRLLPWLAVLTGLLPAHGRAGDEATLVANRNDVSFFVHAAGQRYAIDAVTPLERGPNLFEWQLDFTRLQQALALEFNLDAREINFSEFCAGLAPSGAEQELRTCKKLATIRPGESYSFYFYPPNQPAGKISNIYVIGSKCIVIGNDNQALC